MVIDLQALKDEIQNNPAAMPYLAFTDANDAANADILNNVSGTNTRTVNNETVMAADVRSQTTFDAFDGLTAAEEAWLSWLTGGETIAVTVDTLANLAGIGGTSKWATNDRATMEPRMAALMQRDGSRAEEIRDTLGVDFVTPSDVANARNLP